MGIHMKYKCRKCKRENDLYISHIMTNIKYMEPVFLCHECLGIVLWKKNNRITVNNHVGCDEYIVCGNNINLDLWIDRVAQNGQRLIEVYYNDGRQYKFFPIRFENDYLFCLNDEYSPTIDCGMHRKGNNEEQIPINRIKKIRRMSIYDDYVAPDVETPIIGYKGIRLTDGILGDHKYLYELGIPCEEERRNPWKTDFQDVYFHFCKKMEEVLFDWDMDYIYNPVLASTGRQNFDVRLFRVRGEGHCFENTSIDWVSNKLTLIEEVSQQEIIDYFSNRTDLLNQIGQEDRKYDGDIWTSYCEIEIEPYCKIIEENEIEELFVSTCDFKKDCLYTNEVTMRQCEQCVFFTSHQERMKEYNYLICRSLIYQNNFNENCENYRYLKNMKADRELDALGRIRKVRCEGV